MNRRQEALLVLVMVLALALAGVLAADFNRDLCSLRDLETQLAESRAAWEGIAEKKEALQEELKTTEEALKEARLTLQESAERADSLRADIKALESEIALLSP